MPQVHRPIALAALQLLGASALHPALARPAAPAAPPRETAPEERAPAVVSIFDHLEDLVPGAPLPASRPAACPIWTASGNAYFGPSTDLAGFDGAPTVTLEGDAAAGANGFTRATFPSRLAPTAGVNLRIELDVYITSNAVARRFEPVDPVTSSIVTRIFFGGVCASQGSLDCEASGLPEGPVDTFHSLIPLDPGEPGDIIYHDSNIPVPVNAWFRLAAETTASDLLRTYVNFYDGQGWRTLASSEIIISRQVANLLFAVDGAGSSSVYLDRLSARGLSPIPLCTVDTNADGFVNFADLNNVLSHYNEFGQGLPGDVNGDGVVNFDDLNAMLSVFNTRCCTGSAT